MNLFTWPSENHIESYLSITVFCDTVCMSAGESTKPWSGSVLGKVKETFTFYNGLTFSLLYLMFSNCGLWPVAAAAAGGRVCFLTHYLRVLTERGSRPWPDPPQTQCWRGHRHPDPHARGTQAGTPWPHLSLVSPAHWHIVTTGYSCSG